MNRILVTGDRGFVGSQIRAALESAYEVVGLEAWGRFRDWYDEMYDVMDTPIDAVIHVGGIAESQHQRDDIYLWNSYATFLLAQRVRQKMHSMSPMPFIFFSSFSVGSTMDSWEMRTPYTWSKAQAENFVRVYLPHATILRAGVMWGDEKNKRPAERSVPYRLASHDLKHLFKNRAWNYVHVSDVVVAVKRCLENRPKGTFDLITEYVTNERAATFVAWKGYEWLDDSVRTGIENCVGDLRNGEEDSTTPMPPGWAPKVLMTLELPRLERELNAT